MTEFLPSQVEWFENEKAEGRIPERRSIQEHYHILAESDKRQAELDAEAAARAAADEVELQRLEQVGE